MNRHTAHFRFHEALNDFLPRDRRQRAVVYRFRGRPAIKDAIEAQGVPHAEVDLILVDGASVDFTHSLRDGHQVAVFPVLPAGGRAWSRRPAGGRYRHLAPPPLEEPRFVVDVNLGKLARRLRMLGFDTLYRNDYADPEVVADAAEQRRIILTRDRKLLHHGAVIHGYWVRATQPECQVVEVVRRFNLAPRIQPFLRCSKCNGRVERVAKERIIDRIPNGTAHTYDDYYQCRHCRQVYWEGAHMAGITARLARLLDSTGPWLRATAASPAECSP